MTVTYRCDTHTCFDCAAVLNCMIHPRRRLDAESGPGWLKPRCSHCRALGLEEKGNTNR
jgi:hypothetical protein